MIFQHTSSAPAAALTVQVVNVLGPYKNTGALAYVLGILLDCPVTWIASGDPSEMRRRMVLDKPYPLGRGEGPCVLDYAMEHNDVPAKCIRLVNHLRSHPDLEWEGPLIILVRNASVRSTLTSADLFGGPIGSCTSFGSLEASHRILAGFVPLSLLLSTISTAKPLRHSAWQECVCNGSVRYVVEALHAATDALGSHSDYEAACIVRLHGLARDLDWGIFLPHECGTAVRNAMRRVRMDSSIACGHAKQLVRDVMLLLQATGFGAFVEESRLTHQGRRRGNDSRD